jgi:hypothetical protein
MRRLTLGFVWLLSCSSSLAQQTRSLIDGAHIQLVGTIEPSGNNAYIVIKPSQPYRAVFDDKDHRRVHEIGLTLEGQRDSLKALIGKKVWVSGVIQLEPTSPLLFERNPDRCEIDSPCGRLCLDSETL